MRPAERDVKTETLGDQDAVLESVGEATTVPTPDVLTVALAETDDCGISVAVPEAVIVLVEDELLVPVGEAASVAAPDVIIAVREPVALPIALAVTLPVIV